MVPLARAKVAGAGRLLVDDLRDLPRSARSTSLCLDDAVNYLIESRELRAALTGIAANSARRAAHFDANTLPDLPQLFAEEIDRRTGGGRKY